MEPSELLRQFVAVMDRLKTPYLVTGSMARWPMASRGLQTTSTS
jgi:hypothetical protein